MARSVAASMFALLMLLQPAATKAQFAGTGARDNFRDTTVLRPPTGAKVALIVFEDLGCPACARAHPIEQQVVAETHVPYLRYDYPLEQHVWTFEGAVIARYIQESLGPKLAEEFRSDVFATQRMISTKDDLHEYAARWFQQHGKQMPRAMDADGKLAKQVSADFELGKRLNVEYTPTVVVVTRTEYQVVCGTREGSNDPNEILKVVQAAMAKEK